MNNEKTTEELQKIISWYADRVYYDMTDATNEIEWLVDNLNPKAFQQILDFYKDYNKQWN